MFHRVVVFTVVAALLGTVVGGCGSAGKPVPAKGKVVFKGQPLSGASVSFVPTSEKTQMASGSTDAGGEFTLASAGKPGAVPGEYLVAISKVESFTPQVGAKPEEMAKISASLPKQKPVAASKSVIPVRYADPKQSGLKATVTTDPAKNVFEFNLTEQ